MSVTSETTREAGRQPSPLALRGLEIGALLHAIAVLHVNGMLTDDEYRTKRRRLCAGI